MINLFGLNNVFYDGASIYSNFETINERLFLKKLFFILKERFINFENFDFWIFCGDDKTIPESKNKFVGRNKRVLLYLSDETGYIPQNLVADFHVIFKIHLSQAYPNLNIYPFPLGCVAGVNELLYLEPNKRKYNCFYSGNLNPGREPFWLYFLNSVEKYIFKLHFGKFRILNKYTKQFILRFKHFRIFDSKFSNSIIRFTSKFGTGFNQQKYSELLQQSKIVICPKGFLSPECYRHYEAMRAGCILISEPLPKTFFYKNSPIIEVEDWAELDNIIKLLNSSPEKERSLSQQSKNWYESHMSEDAIASYMIEIIQNSVS